MDHDWSHRSMCKKYWPSRFSHIAFRGVVFKTQHLRTTACALGEKTVSSTSSHVSLHELTFASPRSECSLSNAFGETFFSARCASAFAPASPSRKTRLAGNTDVNVGIEVAGRFVGRLQQL